MSYLATIFCLDQEIDSQLWKQVKNLYYHAVDGYLFSLKLVVRILEYLCHKCC